MRGIAFPNTQVKGQVSNLDPKNDASISAFVHNIWERRRLYKYDLERQWFLNIAYLLGKQNVYWNTELNSLQEPVVPAWRVRIVINLMLPVIRTAISKLYKPHYSWDVIPHSSNIADIQTAELDKEVLNYRWLQQDMDEKMVDTISWMLATGNAFHKVTWNPEKGDDIEFTYHDFMDEYVDPSDPAYDEVVKAARKAYNDFVGPDGKRFLKTGDTQIEVVPPFELTVDPLCTKMDECKFIMHSKLQYIDDIKDRWGSKAGEIVPESRSVSTSDHFFFQQRVNRISSIFNGRVATNTEDSVNAAVVHELWYPPRVGGKFKNGLFAVLCNGKMIHKVDYPYSHGRLPFVHYKEIPIPGRFWGTSTTEQLIAPQTDYNKNKSQQIENRNLMSKPKWAVPKGAGIHSNSFTSEPGEVIEYNYPFKPEPIVPPNLPSYVQHMQTQVREDIEDIGARHEASRATAPGQIRSGRGVLALIEQDETMLAATIGNIERGVAKIGSLVLATDAEFVKEERTAKFIGDDNRLVMSTYTGQDLYNRYGRPKIEYFDVRINTIVGMPNSRVAQMDLLNNLAERGFLTPDRDRDLVFRLLNIGKVQHLLDNSRTHRSKASSENKLLAEGQQVEVKVYQDHDAHIEVHNEYRNSPEFEGLDDNIKQVFDIHEQQHKEARAMLEVEPEVLRQMAVMKLTQASASQGVGNEVQGQEQGL